MRTRNTAILVLAPFLPLALAGCGVSGNQAAENRVFDTVRLITPGEAEGITGQSAYEVSSQRRVLLRYESMNDVATTAYFSADGTYGMFALITLQDSSAFSAARDALRLCPLTRPWMVVANWESAHPFGLDGRWSTPGSDYDSAGCVQANAAADSSGAGVLVFDISQWTRDYPRGSKRNYGHVLVSQTSVVIRGDNVGSGAPKVRYWLPDEINVSTGSAD